jgi:hypothetical protein
VWCVAAVSIDRRRRDADPEHDVDLDDLADSNLQPVAGLRAPAVRRRAVSARAVRELIALCDHGSSNSAPKLSGT